MANAQHIGVIGAGLMGHGIALTLARAGHLVTVTDPQSDARDALHDRVQESMHLMSIGADEIAQTLSRISLAETIAGCVIPSNAVFEAAPERLELKQEIFAEIETHAPDDCILASNTSVIQISKIMGGLTSKHRALGTHWWNPPHLIPLVEVVKTEWTDPSVAQAMFDLLAGAGKTPVIVEKDVPGFIGNRLQHALWREAISLVENGVCSAEAVDDVVKASFGRRLAVLGPLENADMVGIGLTQDIHHQVLYDLETSKEPSPYLQELLDAGRQGMASGQGFRKWTSEEAAETRARVSEYLLKLETILPE